MKKRSLIIYILIILLVLSNVVTFYITRISSSLSNNLPIPIPQVKEKELRHTLDEFTDEMKIFYEVYRILKSGYIQPLSSHELVEGAIEGMLETLDDPHTTFLNPEYMEDMIIHTTGSFSGVGLRIVEKEENIVVIEVIKDTPAYQVGLKAGDIILRVDDFELKNLGITEAARLLRGPKGTNVNILVNRDDNSDLEFEVMRDDIDVKTVFAEIIEPDKKVGYINITNFDQNTGQDFSDSLIQLESAGIRSLILDLRDNPGGLFDEAIAVGKELVPKGEITRVVDRNGNILDTYYSQGIEKPYPIVVLVNGCTASAAEIIAGALQDSSVAVLVGQPTYGKATVQHLEFLSNGAGLRYTMAKYLTPRGRDLHHSGLEPDYKIDRGEAYDLSTYIFSEEIIKGEYGEEVAVLQKMLNVLGFKIKTTGVFDVKTVESLTKFQQLFSLAPTGYLDKNTQEALQKALEQEAKISDEQLDFALSFLSKKIN